jgi:hypothetical protein
MQIKSFKIPVLSSGEVAPIDPEDPQLNLCGSRFCPWETRNGTAGERPSDSKIYLLMGIYLGCAILASAIVAAFVDPLTRFLEAITAINQLGADFKISNRFGERIGSGTGLSGLQLLLATVKHLKDKRQLLLVPLTIFSGLEQGYIGADFTQVNYFT